MEEPHRPNTLKVVLLGDLGVGKTCMRLQYVHHVFTNAYKATIGGDYLTYTVNVPNGSTKIRDINPNTTSTTTSLSETASNLVVPFNDQPELDMDSTTKVILQIWDTAGQERFNSISQAFYRGTDVVVLVYDVTNYESVISLRDWFSRFLEYCHVTRPGVIIVGNKIDRNRDRCVDAEEIRELVTRNLETASIDDYILNWTTDLLEVSCKQRELVEKVFQRVAQVGLQLQLQDGNEGEARRNIEGFDSIDLNEPLIASRCAC
ncbi:uncharacterized protein KQ657_001955 [Scheffersomyces spartinae]|uniref:Uncharacterized protein n=1 Tax=Scheffersomyces spartinae TaxID=45513 RepID=A0A9P8AH86_9ASCO|nr:uncharacterized protein KQ657_001955 [Scheffersomyces spartinae]KAG7192237.1 hypothetical protein KQ657_001955 [Scheffersomyces spartinae]